MTDVPTAKPSYESLVAEIDKLFETGDTATPGQAAAIRTAVDKLLDPGRGSTADFSDPANSGLETML